MESYLWKSGFSLVVLYALYGVMLRYERNHQLNRFIGLACIVFSIAIPFIQFKHVSQAGRFPGMFSVVTSGTADFQETVSSALSASTIDIVLALYILGAGVCLFRCVFGLAALLRLYMHSPRRHQWGFTVVDLQQPVSPFTFFNILFMGKENMDDTVRATMLLHERVHRDQYHSVDNIFLEVVTVLFWFNPVAWLFRRDIKAEHEYYADERVLENGIDREDYQYILFKARTGVPIEFGNHLSSKTSLIKRFNMMTKARTNPQHSYWRVSLYLALMSVIVFLGAFSGRTEEQPFDKIATYKQGEAAMYQILTKRIMYPATARHENRSGLVQVSFTVNEKGHVENIRAEMRKDGYLLKEMVVVGYHQTTEEAKGIDDALKAAAVQAVEGLGAFIPAQKNGKPVSCVLTLPIKFTLETT
ncbi:M56 family metallopeptidase [Parachryseolinea silvisoli]|uniref:M56 family metallopeptidase n=1 Tax=Parachryseolinea silvisoli TaxID=2873601 RepID=UPI002265F8B1|nr:M56 family metallopeptidase [Parachryseolinea silvisoli]MCD9018030.1 M56 family metallopeptidase [Parachryseolinea silvisoli]